MSKKVKQFISGGWDACIRECRESYGTLIGLPYPYTVPAIGHFEEMYYWDTYFTNKGLEIEGRFAQAKNNTDNILYLTQRYGYMPNGNRTNYLKNSQPPFLSLMVWDVYAHYGDKAWLTGAFEILKKEYGFWMRERMTPVGLNRYDGTLTREEALKMALSYQERTKTSPAKDLYEIGRHHVATCESGWDTSPRWDTEAYQYASVDLNSLLFLMEKNMAYFAAELENGQQEQWEQRADGRRSRMVKYLKNGQGLFVDYNFVKKEQGRIFSAASFYPLFAGLADSSEAAAAVEKLPLLEMNYGIAACEKNDAEGNYQWDYPNGWACLQYLVMMGLDRYGYRTEARRIARKYVELADRVFEMTGNLWEKYNVAEGNLEIRHESKKKMPAMMGWSAGVYLAAADYIGE